MSKLNNIIPYISCHNESWQKKKDIVTLFCEKCFKTDISVITDEHGSWCFSCWEELQQTIKEFNEWEDCNHIYKHHKCVKCDLPRN